MYSVAEENYIKSIYHLQRNSGNVTTNELAAYIQTKPASVTDMLKKLEAKHILKYEKYYGVRLTADGRKAALSIIRRHRLWEFFLVNNLGFGWEEVHDMAEQLEHVQHPTLIERLDDYLGHPRFDPHGDPIPDKQGRMHQPDIVLLSEAPHKKKLELSMVADQSVEMLEMLGKKKLELGIKFQVDKHYAYDNSLELIIHGGDRTTVSDRLAQNLYVKLI